MEYEIVAKTKSVETSDEKFDKAKQIFNLYYEIRKPNFKQSDEDWGIFW